MSHWTDALADDQVKDDTRAVRRHQRWRVVQRAVRLFRMWDQTKNSELDGRGLSVKRRAHDPERLADNLAYCRCSFCRLRKLDKYLTQRRKMRCAVEARQET